MTSYKKYYNVSYILNIFLIFIVVLLIVLFRPLSKPTPQPEEKGTTRVLLGLTIDKGGSIVAADPQIEYFLAGIEDLDPKHLVKSARYMPPVAVNHEDKIIGGKDYKLIDNTSVKDIFTYAFKKYGPKNEKIEDYTLIVAKRVFSDSRPLISVWWFTYIKTEDLKPLDKSQ
jgi:hypothetical protein